MNYSEKTLEILAPAGNYNNAVAAVNSGANAIYLGLKQFSARSFADNFDYESLDDALKHCHAFGVKVYVTMNTLIKDVELDEFLSSAVKVWNLGVDAIIISDIFLGKYLKAHCPEMVLHLSTQAGTCNVLGALLAKEYGFERVILARETKLSDIKKIAEIIDTEVFVQGALCTCFSGQCYFSSFVGGNSGNRGKCKQPCRKKYSIDREGFDESAHRLSLSDLSVGENIEELIAAGVTSFKIEGRMRRPEYVAAAVKYYRNILQKCANVSDLSDLKRTFNRGNYTCGLAFGQNKSFISSAVQGHLGEFVGIVQVKDGKYICKSAESFVKGDSFKVLRNGKEVGGANFLCDEKGGFVIASKVKLKNGDKVFITTDTRLNAKLISMRREIVIKLDANFCAKKKAEIFINGVRYESEKPLDTAKTRPLTKDNIKENFSKTDLYPFKITFGNVNCEDVFMVQSELNAFRREAYKNYFDRISTVTRHIEEIPLDKISGLGVNKKKAVISSHLCNLSADIGILKPDDYNSDLQEPLKGFTGEKFLYLPPFMTGEEVEKVKELAKEFDGIYCEGLYGIKLSQILNKPLFAGVGFNISNRIDMQLCQTKYYAISKEINIGEAKSIISDNSFYLTAGDIKIMDLIYCPFGKKCETCDRRKTYELTDENGRKFTIRRYKLTKECRFELYNCVPLAATCATGALLDCTLQQNTSKIVTICEDEGALKNYFKNYTRGHSEQSVF